MDADEFRRAGREMIDFVADYLENIRDRAVLPDVRQGYLRKLIPDAAPETGEEWGDVLKDVERVIMPGVFCFHFDLQTDSCWTFSLETEFFSEKKFDFVLLSWENLPLLNNVWILKGTYCIVPRCSVIFWTHPEIIPVGQFFRQWIKSINQSSADFHCKHSVDWLIDWR